MEGFAAYILINVHSGKDLEVFTKIREVQYKYPIREVSTLYGDYDLIVKIQMTKPGDLEDFIFNGLRPLQGIAETQTLISAKCLEFG
jgi:DNA-binding Lrp family transcriptional regulator